MDKNTLIQLAKDVYQLSLLFPNKEPLRYRMREIADEIVAEFITKRNDYLADLKLNLETIDSFFEIASCQDWTSPIRINTIRDKYQAVMADLMLTRGQTAAAWEMPPAMVSKAPEKTYVEPEFEPVIPPSSVAKGGMIIPPPLPVETVPAHPMVRPDSRVIPVGEPKVPDSDKKFSREEILEAAAVLPSIESDIDLGEEGDDGDEGGTGLTGGQILRQNRILTFLKEKGGAQVWEIQKIFPNVSKRTIRRDFRSMLKQGLIERFGERNTTSYKLKINIS